MLYIYEYSTRFVSTSRPGPKFPGIVAELVDVLAELVVPSESRVTYLSNPRLITTHETVFSTRTERILISTQYLPYCKVTYTASARPLMMFSFSVPIGLLPFASLVLVLSAHCRDTPTLPTTWTLWVASRSRVAAAKSSVPCCTNVVTSSKDKLTSKNGSPYILHSVVPDRNSVANSQLIRCPNSSHQKFRSTRIGIEMNGLFSTYDPSRKNIGIQDVRSCGIFLSFLCTVEFHFPFGLLSLVPYHFSSSPGPRKLQRP